VQAGTRQDAATELLGVPPRTLQRWRKQGIGEDRRAGPKSRPANKLPEAEEQRVLGLVNSPRFRDLSPKQIVPLLADEGVYVASESTVYRLLRRNEQLAHRGRARPATHRRPDEVLATAPNQAWCWDIAWLPTPVRGQFLFLYTILDVFSRKIVGWAVHDRESDRSAAALVDAACHGEGVRRDQLVMHSDNGSPMKGATMLATLQRLGIVPSFSRPGVSDDNPYIESLFRTMKYCPEYPSKPFDSQAAAAAWVQRFVGWYNDRHCHSAISFVTPNQRHAGLDVGILAARKQVYEAARAKHPQRWSRHCRTWQRTDRVLLNPRQQRAEAAVA